MRRDSVFCKSIIKHSSCLLFGALVCRQNHWGWDYINSGCFPVDHGNIGAQVPYSRNFSIDTRLPQAEKKKIHESLTGHLASRHMYQWSVYM